MASAYPTHVASPPQSWRPTQTRATATSRPVARRRPLAELGAALLLVGGRRAGHRSSSRGSPGERSSPWTWRRCTPPRPALRAPPRAERPDACADASVRARAPDRRPRPLRRHRRRRRGDRPHLRAAPGRGRVRRPGPRPRPGEATTSSVAAAVWYPYRAYPFERVLGWAEASYDEFVALARTAPAAGVRMRAGAPSCAPEDGPDPWWAAAVPDLRRSRRPDVPAGFAVGLAVHRSGRGHEPVPAVAGGAPRRPGRRDRAGRGGRPRRSPARRRRRSSTARASAPGPWCPTPRSCPVRGQVVVVEQVGLDEWVVDERTARADLRRAPGRRRRGGGYRRGGRR